MQKIYCRNDIKSDRKKYIIRVILKDYVYPSVAFATFWGILLFV